MPGTVSRTFIFSAFIIVFISLTFSSCKKKEEEEPVEQNKLVGTWKWTSDLDYYWFRMVFRADLTGNRTDADSANDNFTYTYTDYKITFTGFPNGEYNYTIINDTKLVLFGDTMLKL